MCGLAAHPRAARRTVIKVSTPRGFTRPKFGNRANLIKRLAERDCGNPDWRWCWYCLIPLKTPDSITIDHATPLIQGRHWHTPSNYRLACFTCNHLKGEMTEAEYRASPRLTARQREIGRNLHMSIHTLWGQAHDGWVPTPYQSLRVPFWPDRWRLGSPDDL